VISLWFNECCNIKPQIQNDSSFSFLCFTVPSSCHWGPSLCYQIFSISLLLHNMPNAVPYFFLACSCHWPCKWTGLNFSVCNVRFPWNTTVRATLCFLTVNLLYSYLNLIFPGLGNTFFVVMTSLPDVMFSWGCRWQFKASEV